MKEKIDIVARKNYYDFRYTKPSRSPRNLEDYQVFLDYLGLKEIKGAKLFDLACGGGLLLKQAEQKGLKTFGLDISLNAINLAKKITSTSKYVLGNGGEICFKNDIFDYISCLGSLEHFPDIPGAISEMKRIGKPTAKLCIIVPNNVHYRLDAKSKWGIKKIVGTKQQEMQEQLHSFQEWKTILQSNGLKILAVYKDLFFIKKKNPLKNILFYL